MTQIDIAALVADLTTKSAMINMGEKIAWGSETALMDQAVAALIAQDAELKRLREALNGIDALDPEHLIDGCSASALRGLVLRMGELARAALGEKP